MKTSLLFGILPNSKTRVRCVFCGVYIPKANKCIEQHVNGSKHKENVQLMGENGICFNADILHCKPCEYFLPDSESVTKHVLSNSHANWVAAIDDLVDGEFISLDSYLSAESENAFCEVCQINIHCTLQNIEEHVNGLVHQGSVADRLKLLNGMFIAENNDYVWCKVCDEFVDNIVSSILEHIDDDPYHMEWLLEIEDLIEDQGISIQNYLTNKYEKCAFCNKCNVHVLCDALFIEQHINSQSHLSHFS